MVEQFSSEQPGGPTKGVTLNSEAEYLEEGEVVDELLNVRLAV
ncbi:MAG: hypothetical protein WB771_04765 [Solirubrobacterales bacterium]